MWALVMIVLLLLVIMVLWPDREGLTGNEVYQKTGGKVDESYDKFKSQVPEAHIVNYSDFKQLQKEGNYKPENIEKMLNNK
jgi:hypothetical protein